MYASVLQTATLQQVARQPRSNPSLSLSLPVADPRYLNLAFDRWWGREGEIGLTDRERPIDFEGPLLLPRRRREKQIPRIWFAIWFFMKSRIAVGRY